MTTVNKSDVKAVCWIMLKLKYENSKELEVNSDKTRRNLWASTKRESKKLIIFESKLLNIMYHAVPVLL